jgi:hypothetical protein
VWRFSSSLFCGSRHHHAAQNALGFAAVIFSAGNYNRARLMDVMNRDFRLGMDPRFCQNIMPRQAVDLNLMYKWR